MALSIIFAIITIISVIRDFNRSRIAEVKIRDRNVQDDLTFIIVALKRAIYKHRALAYLELPGAVGLTGQLIGLIPFLGTPPGPGD